MGAGAGLKEETGKCIMDTMPGSLKEITDSMVEEFTFVDPADDEVFMEWSGKRQRWEFLMTFYR